MHKLLSISPMPGFEGTNDGGDMYPVYPVLNHIGRIKALAHYRIWLVPTGAASGRHKPSDLQGYMVCQRVVNNSDRPNTRVLYLDNRWEWRKRFKQECLFETMDDAIIAAEISLCLDHRFDKEVYNDLSQS